MKIEAGKTLLGMAKALSNDDTAENSPFILAIKVAEDENRAGIATAVCSSTHDAVHLTEATVAALVKCLKESDVSKEDIFDTLATVMLTVLRHEYSTEDIGKTLTKLTGVPKEFFKKKEEKPSKKEVDDSLLECLKGLEDFLKEIGGDK